MWQSWGLNSGLSDSEALVPCYPHTHTRSPAYHVGKTHKGKREITIPFKANKRISIIYNLKVKKKNDFNTIPHYLTSGAPLHQEGGLDNILLVDETVEPNL